MAHPHGLVWACGGAIIRLFNSLINSVDILDERPNSNYKYIRNRVLKELLLN